MNLNFINIYFIQTAGLDSLFPIANTRQVWFFAFKTACYITRKNPTMKADNALLLRCKYYTYLFILFHLFSWYFIPASCMVKCTG